MTEEVWKQIPGLPLYLVSNKGRVASIMTPQLNSVDYYVVHCATGPTKNRKGAGRSPKKVVIIHRAVLEAFIGPPPTPESVGRHRNDVPHDNRLENLEWGSKSDNAKDAIRNGRWGINENSVKAKLSNEDVLAIRARYDLAPYNLAAIAAEYKISVPHVCGIGRRRFWKHLPEEHHGK